MALKSFMLNQQEGLIKLRKINIIKNIVVYLASPFVIIYAALPAFIMGLVDEDSTFIIFYIFELFVLSFFSMWLGLIGVLVALFIYITYQTELMTFSDVKFYYRSIKSKIRKRKLIRMNFRNLSNYTLGWTDWKSVTWFAPDKTKRIEKTFPEYDEP